MGKLQINGSVNIQDLLTLKSGTDAYSTPSIAFGTSARIGYGSTSKNLGIYSSNKIYLRPNNGALGYSDGIELSTTSLIPTKNNTVALGDSTHKWSNISASSFLGDSATINGLLSASSYKTSGEIMAAPEGTAAGWYRCATLSYGQGTSNNFILSIRRSYYSPANEGYIFSISHDYYSANITQLSGSIGGHLLTKIRVNFAEDGTVYIDYYMNSNGTASYKNTWYISGWGDGEVYAPYLISSYTGSITEFATILGISNNNGFKGNADTATKLKTARTISLTGSITGSGTFDGSGNLSIATTTNHTHSYLSSDITFTPAETALTPENVRALIGNGGSIKRGSWWFAGNGYIAKGTTTKTQCPFGVIDLAGTSVFQSSNTSNQYTQLYITAPNAGTNGAIVGEMLYYIDNGDDYDRIWRRVLTNTNYTDYTVTKTGSGASGTWGINISGNSATASAVAWGNITGKPSSFTPSSHTHSYLVSGGTPSSSTSHADALQTFFNNNKTSIPRNSLLNYYSSAMGNGSQYIGYFLSGYDSTPYGGFFVAHYRNPYYVGISGGSFIEQHILTSTNYNTYTLPLSGGTMSGSITLSKGISIKHYNNMPILEFRGSDSDSSGVRVGDYMERMVLLTKDDNIYHYRYGKSDSIVLDTVNYSSYALPLSGGTMSGTIITPGNDTSVIRPSKNNYDQIGASDYLFWKMYATFGYFNCVITTNYGTSVPTSTSFPVGSIYY